MSEERNPYKKRDIKRIKTPRKTDKRRKGNR
jgi:hypothetical protein